MTLRERFLRTLRYQPVDRRPLYLAGPWRETLDRWRREGLPAHVTDVHDHLGVKEFGYTMCNITPIAGPYPVYERRTLREEGGEIQYIDAYGRTVRDFTSHTTMPEWIAFPVTTGADLRRYMDEHFDVANLERWSWKDCAGRSRS
jgi:hypothetical protein